MPIKTTPSLSEIQSKAQFLRDKEPTRADILRARGFTEDNIKTNNLVDKGSLPESQRETTPQVPRGDAKAIKSAMDVTDATAGTAAQRSARVFAAAQLINASGRDAGTFATQADVKKASVTSDRMLAQFVAQLHADPAGNIISQLTGEGTPSGKNIFQNYMDELATAGITDPNSKLQLAKSFRTDVNKRVEEVRGDFFNRQSAQMFLLQAAQNRLKETNESFKLGLANEDNVRKAKMEAEKHEKELLVMSAQIRSMDAAARKARLSGGGGGSKDVAQFTDVDAKLMKELNDIKLTEGTEGVSKWFETSELSTSELARVKKLWGTFNNTTSGNRALILDKIVTIPGDSGTDTTTVPEKDIFGPDSDLGPFARGLTDIPSTAIKALVGTFTGESQKKFAEAGDRAEEALANILAQRLINERENPRPSAFGPEAVEKMKRTAASRFGNPLP